MANMEQENIQENSKNTEQCLSRRNILTINLVDTPPDKEHDRLRAQMHIIGNIKHRQSECSVKYKVHKTIQSLER